MITVVESLFLAACATAVATSTVANRRGPEVQTWCVADQGDLFAELDDGSRVQLGATSPRHNAYRVHSDHPGIYRLGIDNGVSEAISSEIVHRISGVCPVEADAVRLDTSATAPRGAGNTLRIEASNCRLITPIIISR